MISAKAFWDKTAAKYAKSSIADMASYEKKLAKTQDYFTPQDSILEFGCGTGSTALIHAPFVAHIYAVDISQNMISIAQEKANEQSIDNVTFEQGTLESLEVMTKVYDGVLGLNVLHLLDDIDSAIEKVYKLTKPGGFFISSTALLTDMKWYVKLIIPIMQFLRLAPYVCAINKEQLIDSLKNVGFNIDYQWQPNSVSIFIVAKKPIENPK